MWVASFLAGMLFIVFATRDIIRGESDFLFLCDLLDWEVSRAESPCIFWVFVTLKASFGFGVIAWSLIEKFGLFFLFKH